MARPKRQATGSKTPATLASSAAVYRQQRQMRPQEDRHQIAKRWQVEVYRHVNICGEARYASTLFANMASRAEIGVSEPQTLSNKATWVHTGTEVDAFAELAPTVRERAKLIRDYMVHRTIAGECYLIARDRTSNDPDYEENKHSPLWEIVAVTEIRHVGTTWEVRHDNGNYVQLKPEDPVIRLWNPDPQDRREAWSPFRSLLPTLREIEWLTQHVFTQVRSRLMSAGVWFLPDNLTFRPPPPDSVEGGEEAIAQMNEAEQFMLSLADSSMNMLDSDEVSFPSVVMADAAALDAIDQKKLIQFWSEIDDKAMTLRSDAVRRFALGMDLPPEQVLGSSGIAVSGSSGSTGSVNHWGVWANEEQTISSHIEPGLDDLVGTLTSSFLRRAVPDTDKVIGYDTATLRLRQDRSKEALEWYDRGELSAVVALRENGFDPDSDMMDDKEFRHWLLKRIAGGSATPEQMQSALKSLEVVLPPIEPLMPEPEGGNEDESPQIPGRNETPSIRDHPYEGPPREDHEHNPAPYGAKHATGEVLALRALEKYGNRLLNSGKRGRDKDRTTPQHLAHLSVQPEKPAQPDDFDLTLASMVLSDATAAEQAAWTNAIGRYCADLVNSGEAHSREALMKAVEGL